MCRIPRGPRDVFDTPQTSRIPAGHVRAPSEPAVVHTLGPCDGGRRQRHRLRRLRRRHGSRRRRRPRRARRQQRQRHAARRRRQRRAARRLGHRPRSAAATGDDRLFADSGGRHPERRQRRRHDRHRRRVALLGPTAVPGATPLYISTDAEATTATTPDAALLASGRSAECETIWLTDALRDPNRGVTYLAGDRGGERSGTARDDTLLGGPGGDTLHGANGNDVLWGLRQPGVSSGGARRARRGTGRRHVYGGPGPQLIAGGAGDDLLESGIGDGTITGGTGDDTIRLRGIGPDEDRRGHGQRHDLRARHRPRARSAAGAVATSRMWTPAIAWRATASGSSAAACGAAAAATFTRCELTYADSGRPRRRARAPLAPGRAAAAGVSRRHARKDHVGFVYALRLNGELGAPRDRRRRQHGVRERRRRARLHGNRAEHAQRRASRRVHLRGVVSARRQRRAAASC